MPTVLINTPRTFFRIISCSVGAFQVVLGVKNPAANAGNLKDLGSVPGSGRSPGGGYGYPFQCSCLKNPIDRGDWWAIVHGVAESRTWLKWLSAHVQWHCIPALLGNLEASYHRIIPPAPSDSLSFQTLGPLKEENPALTWRYPALHIIWKPVLLSGQGPKGWGEPAQIQCLMGLVTNDI